MLLSLPAVALGLATVGHVYAQGLGAGSPQYNYIYQYPVPLPPIAQPLFSIDNNGTTVDYYSLTIESFTKQVYPNLGPASLTG